MLEEGGKKIQMDIPLTLKGLFDKDSPTVVRKSSFKSRKIDRMADYHRLDSSILRGTGLSKDGRGLTLYNRECFRAQLDMLLDEGFGVFAISGTLGCGKSVTTFLACLELCDKFRIIWMYETESGWSIVTLNCGIKLVHDISMQAVADIWKREGDAEGYMIVLDAADVYFCPFYRITYALDRERNKTVYVSHSTIGVRGDSRFLVRMWSRAELMNAMDREKVLECSDADIERIFPQLPTDIVSVIGEYMHAFEVIFQEKFYYSGRSARLFLAESVESSKEIVSSRFKIADTNMYYVVWNPEMADSLQQNYLCEYYLDLCRQRYKYIHGSLHHKEETFWLFRNGLIARLNSVDMLGCTPPGSIWKAMLWRTGKPIRLDMRNPLPRHCWLKTNGCCETDAFDLVYFDDYGLNFLIVLFPGVRDASFDGVLNFARQYSPRKIQIALHILEKHWLDPEWKSNVIQMIECTEEIYDNVDFGLNLHGSHNR
jgi:hypothetical protein